MSMVGNPSCGQCPEVAALGRPLYPGMLYDCRKDTFIPGVTLWDKKSMSNNLDSRPQPMTDLKFSSSDSLSSKSSLLDVSASLKASFLGGLVEVGGSAKYLRDTKSSNQQSRVTMSYSETTRFDQLTLTQLGDVTYPQVFDQNTATHVVTAVLYGAQAVMVFDQTFSEEENKQDIEGVLNVIVKKIPAFYIEGKGAINMTEDEKKKAETIACKFYGDIRLEQNPTTYMEALDVYKKLPVHLKENPQNAVPIKAWLYPLSLLDSKAAQLEREITTRLISNTEDIIEELGEVERTCHDLSRKILVNVFRDVKERLQSFQSILNSYKKTLLTKVAMVLPAIRGGKMEEKSLENVLKSHYSSPFIANRLNQWLDGAKSELNILSSHTNVLEGINTKDSNHLSTILLDPNIDVVVCLTFTSLMYEDLYLSTLKEFLESDKFKELDGEQHMASVASARMWFDDPEVISKMSEKLSLFRSFSEDNKEEKRYRFTISAISDPSSPGSSIRLYVKGKLTDPQFQPVSKPPLPEVKEVLEDSVSLKLQKSPTGETVQYRVEYRQVNEEQWHVINTPDEDFTLTGLESRRQYMIRYRIVGKVGVSEASDTIGPMQSSVTCELKITKVGVKKINPEDKTVFRAGENVEITCDETGYWIFHTNKTVHSFTCQDDGRWDYEPACEDITCEIPLDQPLSDPNNYFQGDMKLGAKKKYLCMAGYDEKAAEATCTRDGWMPSPLCAEIVCLVPRDQHVFTTGFHVKMRLGAKTNYHCIDGYKKSAETATCTRDGWTPKPLCAGS